MTLVVHERFADWARRTPSAVAVIDQGRSITYQELDERATHVARRLQAIGSADGGLIGIAATRGIELVVGIIAIFKAGAAYLPLDPSYPAERLHLLVQDSGVDTVLLTSAVEDQVEIGRATPLVIDGSDPPSDPATGQAPPPEGKTDDLAYVIYTSGSTGTPNGVMVSQRNVARLLDSTHHWFGFGPKDVWTLFHSYAFDFSVWELWGALAYGGTLVTVPHEISRSPQLFRQLVGEHGVTVLNQTPSAFYQFIEADQLTRSTDPLALRYVIFGGEALNFPSLRPWFGRHGDRKPRLVNMYGITETTVHVTYREITRQDAERDGVSLIGEPIPDLSLHVLDQDMEPVAAGTVGELYVGGAGVSLGYLNRPALTAQRFLPDPFRPSSTIYRTGDLVVQRADGDYEYHGRVDDQVQLRGFRVELGEVEATLARHPEVASAVAAVMGERSADQRLVAYVVPRTASVTDQALREWTTARLADHMVPSAFVTLDRLPLTPNGKVDRAALPDPGTRRRAVDVPYVAPRDELERYLARMWEEILGLDRVGIHDRFFDLGGTSLQAAQFVNKLQQKLDRPVFEVTIFSAPTIADYARFLTENYADAVIAHFETEVMASARDDPRSGARVTIDLLEELQRYIPTLKDVGPNEDTTTLDPAMFILAPPRSGTTLLRVMLAGHPQLFAAAELLLLGFETLDERRRVYSGRFSLWREGLLRALMEIHGCGLEEAEHIMRAAEDDGVSTKAFYRELQQRIAPRMLVDKSPAYALQPSALRQAERDFKDPVYVHLVRHPQAAVGSFVANRIAQVLHLEPHAFDARTLGELVWTASHRNILAFLQEVPDERHHRLHFEDLVRDPEGEMRGLCARFGLPFNERLVRPYDDMESKMVDGLHPESTPMGDPSFVHHGTIRADVADRRRWAGDAALSGVTLALADQLGSDDDAVQAASQGNGAEGRRGRLLAQRSRRNARRR